MNKKITDFFDKIIDPELGKIVVSKQPDGYMLFSRFYVKQHNDLLYEVVDIKTNQIEQFSYLRNAIAYTSLINCKKFRLANRLAKLDLQLASIDTDLSICKQLYRTSNNNEIQWLKFHNKSYTRKMILHEIGEIIKLAKFWQQRQFSSSMNDTKFNYWG